MTTPSLCKTFRDSFEALPARSEIRGSYSQDEPHQRRAGNSLSGHDTIQRDSVGDTDFHSSAELGSYADFAGCKTREVREASTNARVRNTSR